MTTRLQVVTVVGARPEFIKAAPMSRAFADAGIAEALVHTGQHYDVNMSDQFFEELGLEPPDYNLGVGSASHARQTAEMLIGIETVLESVEPDVVLIYGDTNSTIAGALAAAKLHVPIAHVEAGLRSNNMKMPEEVNRRVTDLVSTLLFCPSQVAVDHLAAEGITEGVQIVGDINLDAVHAFTPEPSERKARLDHYGIDGPFALVTVHRAENTDDPERLEGIIQALNTIASELPVVFPVHPRTRSVLPPDPFGPGVRLIEPVSFIDTLVLAAEANVGLTDSGGLQKELYWLDTPCVTMRDETEWIETVDVGWNHIVGADHDAIVTAAATPPPDAHPALYGDGTTAIKIAAAIADFGAQK